MANMVRHKMFTCILMLLLVFTKATAEKTKADYLGTIRQFYHCLFSEQRITLKKAETLFGKYGIDEIEQYIISEKCKRNRYSDQKCRKLMQQHFDNAETSISEYFINLKGLTSAIALNYTEEEISHILDNSSELIDEGLPSSILIKVNFPNDRAIYFSVNRYADEPLEIGSIFLPDGSEISNRFWPYKQYLQFVGVINDVDGYVNVRKNANSKSPIIGKVTRGSKFYYIPSTKTTWWKIETECCPHIIGYVHSNRIKHFIVK